MVTLEQIEPNQYDIIVNGRTVGYIEASENTLVQIEIFDEEKREERRNGYGTDAVNKLLQQKQNEGYNYVKTTAIINPIFETIVKNIGFEPTENEMTNSYIYRF